MKLLLTSAGIKNTNIHDALVDPLGRPIAESRAGDELVTPGTSGAEIELGRCPPGLSPGITRRPRRPARTR
jgi:hypothetical protein